jgi:hypothetical protein
MEPMERGQWGHGTASVPEPWGEPDLGLPDRRRRPGEGAFDRSARHGTGDPPARPRGKLWQTVLGLGAVAVLVAVLAAGGYLMFTGRGGAASGEPTGPGQHDISNRTADPTPLTETELFPAAAVATSYQLLKSQASPDCKAAAVGEPVKVLSVQDCSQVVRGVLISADKTYVVTVGMFNFGTQVNAKQASESVRDSVGAQKGRFTGFNVGTPPSDVYARAATQLGWDVRGHFLAYCVIARADGKALDDTDQAAHRIIDELVEKYLIGTVLQARVTPPASGSAVPSAR